MPVKLVPATVNYRVVSEDNETITNFSAEVTGSVIWLATKVD